MEADGWIVDKWTKNVELEKQNVTGTGETMINLMSSAKHKLVSAKHKFRGPGIPMAMGTGFPDFICFKSIDGYIDKNNKGVTFHQPYYEIIGVESKMNGYLDKIEKAKCKWYLDNNIFSKILIASKGEKRGTIKYVEFKK